MEKSATIGQLAKALATFQGKVKNITKDGKNPFFKSKYATLGNILDTIKAELSAAGLSVSQIPDGDEGLTTILMHSESGEFLQATYNIHAKQKDPQGIGSAITYARRYSISAILGLNTDEDDDGNTAQGLQQKQAPQAKQMPYTPTETVPNIEQWQEVVNGAETLEELGALARSNNITQASDKNIVDVFGARKAFLTTRAKK